MKIQILHHQELNIPSASGIIKSGSNYFAIGDNSPFLYSLDMDFNVKSRSPFYSIQNLEGDTIVKSLKPDFEAMEIINDKEIIVFGSGSKSPERDLFMIITIDDPISVEEYNITSFYEQLRKSSIMAHQELNIEAVTFLDGKIYLFNRGRNIVFTFDYIELLKYIKGEGSFPAFNATLFALPKINGIEAGFSGAATSKDQPLLFFTASVENTDNAYDDGEVLGSFVGVIEIFSNKASDTYQSVVIPDQSLKVESLAIHRKISNNKADIILVTDSDGGKSTMLRCRLEF